MITTYEREKILQCPDMFMDNIINNSEGKLFFKILTNYLVKTSGINLDTDVFEENSFDSEEKVKESLREVIKYITTVAVDESLEKTYTTGQLAQIFGFSITTINNWIKEGRFINVTRSGKNKQVRISENAIWRTSSNKLVPVKEIVRAWEEENALRNSLTKEQELEILEGELRAFENRYGGTYEQTLKNKANKTIEEIRDEAEWVYLLKELGKD